MRIKLFDIKIKSFYQEGRLGWHKQKQTRILTATREITVIRSRSHTTSPLEVFCEDCNKTTSRIELVTASHLSSMSARDLVRFSDNDELHLTETETGQLFICRESLMRYLIDYGGLK